ncbi:MAG TPA: hypothetical protein DCL77_14150 [Prolixibacteraceae bacterium]|jgi:hypothetical protein|nr:hypothetical protein [Prolixibacteraceae bacterium]
MEKTLRNPGIGHGFGIEFEGPINSFANVAVGFKYHSQTYSNVHAFTLDSMRLNSLHKSGVDSIVFRTGNYDFLELPVTLRIRILSNQRASLFFDGGLSALAFLNQEYLIHTAIEEIVTNQIIKKNAWKNIQPLGSLNLGLTFRYALSERFSIDGSVEYKNHLSKLGALPMELDRVSFKVGVTYQFGKKDEN